MTVLNFKFRAIVCRSILLLPVAAVCLVATGSAEAQVGFGRPNDRPTFSPYLNLFRNQDRGNVGNNTLLNYYGLVRPQNRAFEQRQQFGQEINNLNRQIRTSNRVGPNGVGVPRYSQIGITGHPTAFMTIRPGVGGGGGGEIGAGGIGSGSFGGSAAAGSFGGSLGGPRLGAITGHSAAFSAGVRSGGSSGFGGGVGFGGN